MASAPYPLCAACFTCAFCTLSYSFGGNEKGNYKFGIKCEITGETIFEIEKWEAMLLPPPPGCELFGGEKASLWDVFPGVFESFDDYAYDEDRYEVLRQIFSLDCIVAPREVREYTEHLGRLLAEAVKETVKIVAEAERYRLNIRRARALLYGGATNLESEVTTA